jgi:hypothetical protein
MKRKRILVLGVSAGAGHVRAAQALCAAAHTEFAHLEVTHPDVMDLVSQAFRKVYADSYIKLVEKMPLAWAYLYRLPTTIACSAISCAISNKSTPSGSAPRSSAGAGQSRDCAIAHDRLHSRGRRVMIRSIDIAGEPDAFEPG